MKYLNFLVIYFHFIILNKDFHKHYKKRKYKYWNGYDEFMRGFEIINTKINKVVLRRGKHSKTFDKSPCRWVIVNNNYLKNIQ